MANALRKRQSRLAFTPLPSSSPAAKGYPKQMQERAAAVSLDSSPYSAKRRKMKDNDVKDILGGAQLDGVNDSIPTPAASLEHGARDIVDGSSQDDSEPIRSTQRQLSSTSRLTSGRRRPRQQHLDFSSARDPDSFSSPIKLTASAKPRSSTRAGIFSSPRQGRVVDVSSSESDELVSPGKLMAKSTSKHAKRVVPVGGGRGGAARMTRSTHQFIPVDSESDSEDIVVGGRRNEPIEVESEDEDDDMPTALGTQRRKRARRTSRNSFISSSPPIIDDSDNDLEIIDRPRKRPRRGDSDDEEELVTPSKRKRLRKPSRREKDEIAADVEDLGPSSDIETSVRKPRNTQTARKDARQQALDRLKRRRSGHVAEPDPAGDEHSEEDDGQDDIDELYDDDDDKRNQRVPLSSARMFNADEDDEDFVEEDEDEAPLGVPEGVPLEFTRYASMRPKELFKHAVEWMVQKKINPGFKMGDGLYALAFQKLDDEVKGLAGSKFTSAAWTPDFTFALKSRPDIAYEPIDRSLAEHFMRDKCDACNRSSHPATYQIQFQGALYNHQTLEELGGSEDDDSNSDESQDYDADDHAAYDAEGREIPPANRIYYVGKFCMANAKTSHALQHWRYHLNEWVVSWLIRQGYNSPEKIVERDRWSTDKRGKHANKITDRMEQEGIIKTLWSEFKDNIDNARNAKQGRYRGESP